jgi:hypothetical protein
MFLLNRRENFVRTYLTVSTFSYIEVQQGDSKFGRKYPQLPPEYIAGEKYTFEATFEASPPTPTLYYLPPTLSLPSPRPFSRLFS